MYVQERLQLIGQILQLIIYAHQVLNKITKFRIGQKLFTFSLIIVFLYAGYMILSIFLHDIQ